MGFDAAAAFEKFRTACEGITAKLPGNLPWWIVPVGAAVILAIIFC